MTHAVADEPVERNLHVRDYWEAEPCGTQGWIVGERAARSPEWFAEVESSRYRHEPFIPAIARFPAWRGRRVLEIGVGAGADHLQFARSGAELYGVDLTDAAIETTRAHLALHGLSSQLSRVDAEVLPFEDGFFDLVYSWGVIHHSAHPEAIIDELHRVLEPGGTFIGMLYARHSLTAAKLWVRHAALQGRPFTSLRAVVSAHMESPGTFCYTPGEVRKLFGPFGRCRTEKITTIWDRQRLPAWVGSHVPNCAGWFIAIEATRA